MDVFSRIEGLSGENFGSALLGYLILNSQEVRDAVISVLSDNSPIGPINHLTHFSCRTEYPTSHPQYGDGRVDILLQLDDVVIGIENKFFADFQNNQPVKYYDTIKMIAESLSRINRCDVRSILYVLCPESRKEYAFENIKGLEDLVGIITWEDLLTRFKEIERISNPISQAVLNEFIQFLYRRFSFVPEFERKASHLRKVFPNFGSPLQGELVGKLWSVFPSPGARLSYGKTWIGYYFLTDPSSEHKGWFGFVDKSEIVDNTKNQAELIVVTTFDVEQKDYLLPVKLRNPNFIKSPSNTHSWSINFDKNWNSIDRWRNKLDAFIIKLAANS